MIISGGKIQIVRHISVGTYFDAYEAADTFLDRPVFLKLARSSDDSAKAAIVEAHVHQWRALARENVPGMPTILDIGQETGRWFLTTEWIKSPPLRTLADIKSGIISDPTRFLILLLERCLLILEGLHARGFVHGDLSTGNIMADLTMSLRTVYLVDPSPPLNLPDPNDPMRRLILTTPEFLAPEVLAGQPATPRSDMFALGMVIHEAARLLHAATPNLVKYLTARQQQDRPFSAEEALAKLRDNRGMNLPRSPNPSAPLTGSTDGAQKPPREGLLGRIGRLARRQIAARSDDISAVGSRRNHQELQSRSDFRLAASVALSVPFPLPTKPFPVSTWVSVPVPQSSRKLPALSADFSVIAPNLIQAGRHFVVEVWIAPGGQISTMLEQATRSGRMIERGSRSHIDLDRDTLITVIMKLPDFEVPDPVETLGWNGDIRNVGFIVRAQESLAPGIYPGSAKLMQGQIPFASIMFDLEVASPEGHVEASPGPLSAHIQRIARAFASYASRDRGEVLRRVQGIQASGIKVFLDIVNLRSGEDWERTLYQEIDASDGFFLFWSRNAARSQWVEREWQYALKRRGLEFINPLALEDPRLAEPPVELRGKHFNDMLLTFIKAEDAIHRGGDVPP